MYGFLVCSSPYKKEEGFCLKATDPRLQEVAQYLAAQKLHCAATKRRWEQFLMGAKTDMTVFLAVQLFAVCYKIFILFY